MPVGKLVRSVTAAAALAAVAAGGLTAATTLGMPAPAYAADNLCNVNQNTWVRSGPGTQYQVLYTIPAGGGFRITGPRGGGWILGHGNGKPDGFIPNDGRLYNC